MKKSRIALFLVALGALTAVGFSFAGSSAPQAAKDCCASGSSCCTEDAACCK